VGTAHRLSFVLSEAALVLVIVIEVLEITMNRRIDFDHEHENPNCRAKPVGGGESYIRGLPSLCMGDPLLGGKEALR
jgi:hypothetical protein